MMTSHEIINILKKKKPLLERELGVKRIGLFGSYAKNIQNKDSDIDIFVELEQNDYRTVFSSFKIFRKGVYA